MTTAAKKAFRQLHTEAIILRKFHKASTTPLKSAVLVVRTLPSDPCKGILRAGNLTLHCALGKGGISANKREGDGATPLASLRPLAVFFRGDRRLPGLAQTRLPKIMIRPDHGWCDAPGDYRYNLPVRTPYPASHETMLREDRLYNVCIVLDWNMRPARRNRGSAIFMHIAKAGMKPTEGCIALQPRDMNRLLPLLNRHARIQIIR
jgi:L,D-peptidoglycan transpeptidase YkuD (ErfK/YbiS/YcfS/YnhG family)